MPTPIVLDVRKLLCPLPVIRLQQAIQQHENEVHLIVLATDPGVLYDIPAWCRIHGHSILHTEQTKQEIRIEISINKPPLRDPVKS